MRPATCDVRPATLRPTCLPAACYLVLLLAMLACSFPIPTLPPELPGSETVAPASPRVQVVVATPTPLPDSLVAEATAEDLLLVNLYARVNPGVVNIDVAAGAGR
jgi:multidrug efflux pump subunit AcrA (membrane-fusion protein)